MSISTLMPLKAEPPWLPSLAITRQYSDLLISKDLNIYQGNTEVIAAKMLSIVLQESIFFVNRKRRLAA